MTAPTQAETAAAEAIARWIDRLRVGDPKSAWDRTMAQLAKDIRAGEPFKVAGT